MTNHSKQLQYWTELLTGHLYGELNAQQQAEFEQLTHNPHFDALRRRFECQDYIARRMAAHGRFDSDEAFERFRAAAGIRKPAGKLHRLGIIAASVAAAAALVAGLFWADRLLLPDEHTRTMQLAETILPTPDKVVLTLPNGRQMVLDTQTEQQIDGVGRLSYDEQGVRYEQIDRTAAQAMQYSELTVPEGNKCLVTLEDGTRVWLNAKSSLRYPVRFSDNERRVTLTGEGLFDVTHNPQRPFVVEAGKATLRVRGTKFNVRDFADETTASTTLLEGCVEVSNQSGMVVLQPGMQAQTRGMSAPLTTREVDATAYAAWTEDKIAFYSATLEEVLSDICRWYRVDVVTNVEPGGYTLTGKIPRSYTLANVISLLEAITDLEFVMSDEKTLLVNKRQL